VQQKPFSRSFDVQTTISDPIPGLGGWQGYDETLHLWCFDEGGDNKESSSDDV
jgi:hypothetical protein